MKQLLIKLLGLSDTYVHVIIANHTNGMSYCIVLSDHIEATEVFSKLKVAFGEDHVCMVMRRINDVPSEVSFYQPD